MYDRNTGKPRGFGFITYKDERSIDLVLQYKFQHKIRNKWIECKRATPKVINNGMQNGTGEQNADSNGSFSSDPMLIPSNREPMPRKLSVENLAYPAIVDSNSIQISQTTSPNTIIEAEDDIIGKNLSIIT